MGRTPNSKKEVKKGPWTPEEDQKLVDYIQKHGTGSWRSLPANAGISRCGKSCRLRWMNYLRPDIKRGRFSFEEEEIIIQLHRILGNNWSAIAARLPGRTGIEIKNYWNSHTSKRLQIMGINPATQGPSLANTPDNLFLRPSSFNPTQLLVSRLLGLKSVLSLKLLTMASSNANQNIVEQQMNNTHVEAWQDMIPRELNADQLLNVATHWQGDVNSNFEVQANPAQIEGCSFSEIGNDQSLLDSDNFNSPSTYFDGSIEDIVRGF